MEYAAGLAVAFSSKRGAPTAEVDYTPVKNIKKPAGARPGFVIYHVYRSMLAKPAENTNENMNKV